MHRATLRLESHPLTAEALAEALGPEVVDGPPGTTITASAGDGLHLEVTAQELSAMRAALQGVLRLVDAARGAARSGAQSS